MITLPDPGWMVTANGSHEPQWAADILTADGDTVVGGVPFTDGTVSIDEARRTTMSLDVPAAPLPALLDEAYLPLGTRLRARYRLAGSPQWMTVADCDFVASALARPEGVWTLAAADQTHRIDLDDLVRGGIALGAADTVATAIRALIRRTFPDADIRITGAALTDIIPAKADYATDDGSPWDLIRKFAAGSGAIAWQDAATRTFHVEDLDVTGPTVDRLAVGEGGQVSRYTVEHQLANNTGVARYIDDQDPPGVVTGIYEDRRPGSPVSVDRVGTNIVAKLVQADVPAANMPTQARADAAAAALLLNGASLMRDLEVVSPARPWLQPGDYVEVDYLGGPYGERQRIRSVGIGMAAGAEQVTRMWSNEYTVEPI